MFSRSDVSLLSLIPLCYRSRLDGEKPEEDEIRTKEDGEDDKDGKEVTFRIVS